MRAVVYLPPDLPGTDRAAHEAACLAHCAEQGYEVDSVTSNWRAVRAVLCADLACVLVVATRAHLDPARTPRTEFADEAGPQRRPRRLD
jgi:hypothetical protein